MTKLNAASLGVIGGLFAFGVAAEFEHRRFKLADDVDLGFGGDLFFHFQ